MKAGSELTVKQNVGGKFLRENHKDWTQNAPDAEGLLAGGLL